MDDVDRAIVDALHGGFPLCERPYAEVATRLGMTEAELLARLGALLDAGTLTRFGPLFQIERAGGAFVLAALAAGEADFERIAGTVNALPEVAHNYRRAHALDMWFVVAAESPARADEVLREIEVATGREVLAFPKEREYFVELRLPA
jgi:DNA-binding Lrp family transcriptional regulator